MGLEGGSTRWMENDCTYVRYNRATIQPGMTMHSPLHLPLNVILKPRLVPLTHATYHVIYIYTNARNNDVTCLHACSRGRAGGQALSSRAYTYSRDSYYAWMCVAVKSRNWKGITRPLAPSDESYVCVQNCIGTLRALQYLISDKWNLNQSSRSERFNNQTPATMQCFWFH